jgi:hypothetical protein
MTAKAAPDGYTLLLASATHGVNPGLRDKLPYDSIKDFTPVTLVASSPLVFVAHPALGVSNIKELVAAAKANNSQRTRSMVCVLHCATTCTPPAWHVRTTTQMFSQWERVLLVKDSPKRFSQLSLQQSLKVDVMSAVSLNWQRLNSKRRASNAIPIRYQSRYRGLCAS